MKSIKTKFLALVAACVMTAAVTIGAAGFIILNENADRTSASIINKTCELETEKLNNTFAETEHAVKAYADHICESLDSLEDHEEKEYLLYYSDELSRAALSYASNTEGVMSVYVRFSPEYSESPVAGVFYIKDKETGMFRTEPLTDLSLYDETETNRVGWYYVPIENKEPMWLDPYMNDNVGVYMISYVVPLFDENGKEIGVVGMDIDFDEVGERISDIKVYENGKAFLVDGTDIVFHPDMGSGSFTSEAMGIQLEIRGRENSIGRLCECDFLGGNKMFAFDTLRNDMKLILAVPESEINSEKHTHARIISVCTLIVLTVSSVISAIMAGRIIRPLRELNSAFERIADGDLEAEIEWHSNDEIGVLAESFRKTTVALKKNDSYIKEIAYRDALTGVRNASAYHEAVNRINQDIAGGKRFSVAVFDINDLKLVNDNLGHAYGDILIETACGVIRRSFVPSPVFRIGGDEFAVILEDEESGRAEELMEHFRSEVASFNDLGRLGFEMNVAGGYAEFDSSQDEDFISVFNRADRAMYANKRQIKELALEELRGIQ